MSRDYKIRQFGDEISPITAVQQALELQVGENGGPVDPALRRHLGILAERIKRLQRLGGAYAKLDLSPEVKALISQQEKPPIRMISVPPEGMDVLAQSSSAVAV